MSVRNIQVLGSGPAARELEAAYQRLGATVERTPSLSPGSLETTGADADTDMVVIGGAVDAATLDALKHSGVAVAPSTQACSVAFDRAALRRKASEELGLPTLAYEYAADLAGLEQAVATIGYPCVIKHGRTNVVLHDADAGVDLAGVPTPALVERYIEFDYEVTILTARSIDPATGELATWFCEPLGTHHDAGGGLVEVWQPASISEAAMGSARSIAARITSALDCLGLFAIELFMDGEEVYFSQAHPVLGWDGMLTSLTQRRDQFELFARASLGLPIDVTLTTPGACQFITLPEGVTVQTLARALAVEETSVEVLGTADGDVVVRSSAETVDEARQRAAQAVQALKNFPPSYTTELAPS